MVVSSSLPSPQHRYRTQEFIVDLAVFMSRISNPAEFSHYFDDSRSGSWIFVQFGSGSWSDDLNFDFFYKTVEGNQFSWNFFITENNGSGSLFSE